MSKSNDTVLLVPGETSWEIWTRSQDGPFALHPATEAPRASDLAAIPSGELAMLFPVRSFTTVPMRVTTDDEALFPDLAVLHAERLGIRTDPMAGQLSDVFLIEREPENSAILAVFLRSPGDGELPPRGPQSFDLSPRAFPLEDSALCLWREFSRWVFAFHHQGKLVYTQATACDSAEPDAALAREIRLSLIQLGLQGLPSRPSRVVVWSSAPVDVAPLAAQFQIPVELAARPAPLLPDPPSRLLPADVRAARRAAARKRAMVAGISTAAAAYLAGIGWLANGVWQTYRQADELVAEANRIAPDASALEIHQQKWDELADAIQIRNSTVDILHRIHSAIPPQSGLRLRTAEIEPNSIKLIGEAPQPQPVKTFSRQLQSHNELTHFVWEKQEPTQKSRGWEFQYSASVPSEPAP